jgi:hypothetical protein
VSQDFYTLNEAEKPHEKKYSERAKQISSIISTKSHDSKANTEEKEAVDIIPSGKPSKVVKRSREKRGDANPKQSKKRRL